MKVEQFENSLLKLNKKFNLEVTVQPSTSRDFRYKPDVPNPDCEEEDIDEAEDENMSSNQARPPCLISVIPKIAYVFIFFIKFF